MTIGLFDVDVGLVDIIPWNDKLLAPLIDKLLGMVMISSLGYYS